MRKCRPKYLEHVLHTDKLATAKAQNSSRAVGSDGTKTYFLVTFSDTKNGENLRESVHTTPHTHGSKLSVPVN